MYASERIEHETAPRRHHCPHACCDVGRVRSDRTRESEGWRIDLQAALSPLSWREIGWEWPRCAVLDRPTRRFRLQSLTDEIRLGTFGCPVQRRPVQPDAQLPRQIDR